MKTSTMTYHRAYNYGAVLQAYALQQKLLSLQIENEIIDFDISPEKIFYAIEKSNFRYVLLKIFLNIVVVIHYNEIKRFRKKFDYFVDENLKLTKKYNDLNELKTRPPVSDCLIVGSDQVWNFSTEFRPGFVLDFGSEDIKRVSYAASMGICEMKSEYLNEFLRCLKKFNQISVREDEAKIFIEKNSKKKSCVNVDPVFLLSQEKWNEIVYPSMIGTKYILCYPLLYHPLLNETLAKIKKITGYKIVIVLASPRTKIHGDIYIRDAGPSEFLGLVRDAEFVFTTSFHGVAFSTIFEKKFFSFVGSHAPTRITSILDTLQLNNRVVRSINDITTKEIDYTMVNNLKMIEIEKAHKYLKSIVSENEQD